MRPFVTVLKELSSAIVGPAPACGRLKGTEFRYCQTGARRPRFKGTEFRYDPTGAHLPRFKGTEFRYNLTGARRPRFKGTEFRYDPTGARLAHAPAASCAVQKVYLKAVGVPDSLFLHYQNRAQESYLETLSHKFRLIEC